MSFCLLIDIIHLYLICPFGFYCSSQMSILHICATFHTFNGELGDELEDFGCKFVNILSKFVFLMLLFHESLSHT